MDTLRNIFQTIDTFVAMENEDRNQWICETLNGVEPDDIRQMQNEVANLLAAELDTGH